MKTRILPALTLVVTLTLAACDPGHTGPSSRGENQSERREQPIALDDPNTATKPNVTPAATPGRTDSQRPQQQGAPQ